MSGLYLPWDKPRRRATFEDNYSPRRMRGWVTWRALCKKTGAVLFEDTVENVITFLATQVIAKGMGGDPNYKITHIYGEHADPGVSGYIEGSTNGLVAARSDTIDTLRTAPRSTTGAEVPVLTTAYGTTTDISGVPTTDYDQNVLTVTSIFSDASLDGRIFVGAGLVTQVSGTELLYAHSYRDALIKLSSFDIQVAWSTRYL